MSTPPHDPEQLQQLSGFLIALQEQDKLLTEAMNARQREISVPHVGFIKGIFDKIMTFDSNLAEPFAIHADPVTSLAQIRDVVAKIKTRIMLLSTDDVGNLRKKHANLTRLRSEFERQSRIIEVFISAIASLKRAPKAAVNDVVRALTNDLSDLFAQANVALPEKRIHFEHSDELDDLRGQLDSACVKIAAGLALSRETSPLIHLPSPQPPTLDQARKQLTHAASS